MTAMPRSCPRSPARTRRFASRLRESRMVVTIHNAGEGYHQEIWDPKVASLLTGLDAGVIAKGVLRGKADPFLLSPRTRGSTRCPRSMQPSCSGNATRSSPADWAARTGNAVCRSPASPTAWTGQRGTRGIPSGPACRRPSIPARATSRGNADVGKPSSPGSVLAPLSSILTSRCSPSSAG